ncbi:hypothetical protein NQZ68_014219 [Dissostichus eleginoides]|nr:hypothetical protein NQZ68_014219 [Dissostichus eleginoides]
MEADEDVKMRGEGGGKKEERQERLKTRRKREMERRDGGGTEGREGGAYCPETTAERGGKREQKNDSLTAAPNGFSGERERGRRRHNEGAMTEAEIDLERRMEGGRQREVEVSLATVSRVIYYSTWSLSGWYTRLLATIAPRPPVISSLRSLYLLFFLLLIAR